MADSNDMRSIWLSWPVVALVVFNILFFAGLYFFGTMLMQSYTDSLVGTGKMLALISFWAIGNYGLGLIICSETRARKDA